MDAQKHKKYKKYKKYTGVDNKLILKNLEKLLEIGAPIWVRIPIIPGVNDTKEEMKKIRAFFDINGYPQKIELLPYHVMEEHKYLAIGKNINKFNVPNNEVINNLKNIFIKS